MPSIFPDIRNPELGYVVPKSAPFDSTPNCDNGFIVLPTFKSATAETTITFTLDQEELTALHSWANGQDLLTNKGIFSHDCITVPGALFKIKDIASPYTSTLTSTGKWSVVIPIILL